MVRLSSHPVLSLSIAAAAVYLWLNILGPTVLPPAPSQLPVSAPVSKRIDNPRPAPTNIEPAPFWD
jgi:hypothetical protein